MEASRAILKKDQAGVVGEGSCARGDSWEESEEHNELRNVGSGRVDGGGSGGGAGGTTCTGGGVRHGDEVAERDRSGDIEQGEGEGATRSSSRT